MAKIVFQLREYRIDKEKNKEIFKFLYSPFKYLKKKIYFLSARKQLYLEASMYTLQILKNTTQNVQKLKTII